MKNSAPVILIVDDDPDIAQMIKTIIDYKGYNAVVNTKAEQTELIIQKNKPDLMIMDMLMSGVNGAQLCKQIKNNPATAEIPIIMMSAHPHAKALCEEAGANGFLSKPFDMQEILLKIDELLKIGAS